MIDYIFNNEPKYLLMDELDKMSAKDQTFVLDLMERNSFRNKTWKDKNKTDEDMGICKR